MTNIKAIFYCKFLLFNILLFVTSVIFAQDLNFRENEFIDIGGGQKFKILRFRGEGTEKECEVFHYLNGKRVGDAFWLRVDKIPQIIKVGKWLSEKYPLPAKSKTRKTPPLKKPVTQKEVFAGKETNKQDTIAVNTVPQLKTVFSEKDSTARLAKSDTFNSRKA